MSVGAVDAGVTRSRHARRPSSVELVETMSVICDQSLCWMSVVCAVHLAYRVSTRSTIDRSPDLAPPSDDFHDRGDPHPATDAERGEATAQVAAVQLVDQGPEEHRAGGPERVAHR